MAGVSMKDIKVRIRSMESTRQITKAMEMVASSKLRRAQENVLRSRPYFEVLYSTLNDIASVNRELTSPYVIERPVNKRCLVVIAGDRGLAGGYNHNILNLAGDEMEEVPSLVVPIGKKALEYFQTHSAQILSDSYTEAGEMSISDCFTMARILCRDFRNGEFDELRLVYTHFASLLVQTPSSMTILPLHCGGDQRSGKPGQLTLYEPDSETVFNRIIPEYLGGLIYGALRESVASEQAARRMAMDAATKNADDMIEDLNLKYNRVRQGAITQEITEIVAGADA